MKYLLATFLVIGHTMAGNYENDFTFQYMAATIGDNDAADKVGHFYFRGQGVEQDYIKALPWLMKAAEYGKKDSQYTLGIMFKNALGVQRDINRAMGYFRSAARLGHPKAQFNLGITYYKSHEVPRDDTLALQWFQEAAKSKDPRGQCFLAEMYEKGRGGLSKDYGQALHYYEKSQAQGYERAQTKIDALLIKISGQRSSHKKSVASSRHSEKTQTQKKSLPKEKGTEVPECSICLDKKLNRVFIPCGHTTCETCAERLVGKACPMCKKLINQAIPLFL